MKKFLMYVIIVVTCLFLGFTIYYLTQNNETIYLTISKDEAIYKNKGESIGLDDLLAWTKPYKTTTITITSADETVVVYDENTKRFNCMGGGFSAITITTSNEKYGPFVFDVRVGDGTMTNPYILDSAEDIALIGNDPELKFNLSNHYVLTKDIDLRAYNSGVWNPLGELTGSFNGDGHTLYNLNVTQGPTGGLFTSVAGTGLVENVKFANAVINGSFDNVGVVAGVNKGTIGKIEVKSANITNTSTTGNTGSIVGSNLFDVTTAMVNMCSAKTQINANGNVGGLVGLNKSSIALNSYAIVDKYTSTDSTAKFGGLVGVLASTYKTAEEVYYAAAIKNCYSVINAVEGSANQGALIGENAEETFAGQSDYNKLTGCIYALNSGVTMNDVVLGKDLLTADAKAQIVKKSKEELLEQASYAGYNFDTIWQVNTSETASLNYKGGYEVYTIMAIGKELTPAVKPFDLFLKGLVGNTINNVVTYKVNEDTVVDLGGAYWTTIAPSENAPLLASIYVEEGVSCIIKNFKLRDTNSSFFGYIGGNTSISGITFEDVMIESCSAENSAIVATGLLKGSLIEDITVKNIVGVETKAKNIGLICAYNMGTIKNCSVVNDELKNVKLSLSESLTSMGAIVGYNDGNISDCSVDKIELNILVHINKDGSLNFGGIAGTTLAEITNCKVLSFKCDTTASGLIYAGGIVGYVATTDRSNIKKCYSLANIKIKDTNGKAYVGGITGYLAGDSTLSGSFYEGGELWAHNVGGLVSSQYGTVFSSYVGECSLKGCKVGGLSTTIYGKITDCYVLANLEGSDGDSVCGAFSYYLGPDCYMEHLFSDATFSGKGQHFAETFAEFRLNKAVRWYADLFHKDSYGTYKNNIVLVNNGAEIQYSTQITKTKTGFIDATREQCNGTEGNYSVFKDKAGFDINIWDFTGTGFPKLIDVVTY